MEFSENYLYDCISVKKFFKLPITTQEKNYFVNDGQNSVVKLHDQKLAHSWTLEHPHYFTSPIVFSEEEDSLYCVIDHIALTKWSVNDETLKTAAKFQLQENIFAILHVPNHRPVVLFSSGKVLLTELLHVSLKPIGESFVRENEELVWADALSMYSAIKIVCLVISEDNTFKMHHFSIEKETITDHVSKELENGDHSLKNWCLNKFNFTFITIWDNGSIVSHPLQNKCSSTLMTVADVKPTNFVAISCVDADHLVTAKSNENKKEIFLEMWCTKFASVRVKKVLKGLPSDCLQLSTENSSIFLLIDDKLNEIPFGVERSTLASALGSSAGISKNVEYSWKGSTVINESEEIKNDLSNTQENINEMEMDEEVNQIEHLIKRFMEEGSSFRTNNRESDLFDLLRYALRSKCEKKEEQYFEPDVLLSAIFTSSYREAALCQYIVKLNLEEILIAIETLLDISENKIPLPVTESPTDSQIFEWVLLIMKCHTQSLQLSKDQRISKLIKRLNHCIDQNMEAHQFHVKIQNKYYVLTSKENMLPTRHTDEKYSIETMDI